MTYLGTHLDPDRYYQERAGAYVNGQADAAVSLLERLVPYLQPRVLDLGCGAGLATQALIKLGLTEVVGSDRAPEMVQRYIQETGKEGIVASFWEEQPKAASAICVHALHLCPHQGYGKFAGGCKKLGCRHWLSPAPLKEPGMG